MLSKSIIVALVLGLSVVPGLAQVCSSPITLGSAAIGVRVVITNHQSLGWVISSVDTGSSGTGSGAITIVPVAFWEAQLANLGVSPFTWTIQPGAAGSGVTAASCSALTATSVTLTWTLTNGTGSFAFPQDITTVVVTANIVIPPGKTYVTG